MMHMALVKTIVEFLNEFDAQLLCGRCYVAPQCSERGVSPEFNSIASSHHHFTRHTKEEIRMMWNDVAVWGVCGGVLGCAVWGVAFHFLRIGSLWR